MLYNRLEEIYNPKQVLRQVKFKLKQDLFYKKITVRCQHRFVNTVFMIKMISHKNK